MTEHQRRLSALLCLCALLVSCTPPPPVNESREVLWKQFAHQSIDKLLLAWGPPDKETKLTNGSRMVTYTRATVFDASSPYESATGCEVSFLAPAPHYHIENIAMKGNGYECKLLAQGKTGTTRNVYVPPPPPFYPGPFYFYR